MAFTREELRKIIGEAYTDDIGKAIVQLHRGVLDPLKDDLDSAKADAAKWQKQAEKVPTLETELADLKKEDWKAKYEKEHADFDGYKTKVAQDAETAKLKAAYKKLLVEEKISEKTLDAVMAATDYSKMKLKEDGTLDGIEGLKKDIADKWGGFRVNVRQRGPEVETPPGGAPGGSDGSVRSYVRQLHEARFGAPQQK